MEIQLKAVKTLGIALVGLTAAACGGGGGGGGSPAASANNPGDIIELRTGDSKWFAWQQGALGAWKTEAANTTVKISPKSQAEPLGVAVVCNDSQSIYYVEMSDSENIPVCTKQPVNPALVAKLRVDILGAESGETVLINIVGVSNTKGNYTVSPYVYVDLPAGDYAVSAATYRNQAISRVTLPQNVSINVESTDIAIDLANAGSAVNAPLFLNNIDSATNTSVVASLGAVAETMTSFNVWVNWHSIGTAGLNTATIEIPLVSNVGTAAVKYNLSFIANTPSASDSPVLNRYLILESANLQSNDVFELPRERPAPELKAVLTDAGVFEKWEWPVSDERDEVYGQEQAYEMGIYRTVGSKARSIYIVRSRLVGSVPVAAVAAPDFTSLPGWNSEWNFSGDDEVSWNFTRVVTNNRNLVSTQQHPLSLVEHQGYPVRLNSL